MIYTHIPFRKSQRVFDSAYTVEPGFVHAGLISAMMEEISYYGDRYGNVEEVTAIQFGGGDSSLLKIEHLHSLLLSMRESFQINPSAELSMEIDPSDQILQMVPALYAEGINRLSLSAISFFQDDIDLLGGRHKAEWTEETIELARSSGISNISVDLFFGLPERDMEYWAANLEKASRLGIPHISVYGLTGDEVEILADDELPEPLHIVFEKEEDDQYTFTMEYLKSKGYVQYDICNFALEGHVSENARAYSQLDNFIGIGPSAHSLWRSGLPDPSIYRWSNVPNIEQYQNLLYGHNLPLEQKYPVDLDELAGEYLMLRLRTNEGVNLDDFESEFGVDIISDHLEFIAELESEQYIEPIRNSVLQLTNAGRLRSDKILQSLLKNSAS